MLEGRANFPFTLSKNPTDKEWQQLLKELNTYIDSSSFIRQGSIVDQYDPDTGKHINRPLYNVQYKKSFYDDYGIPAQTFRATIKQAVSDRDINTLRKALQHKYYKAQRFLSDSQKEELENRKRRSRLILQTVLLSGAGALAGLIPYYKAKKENRQIDPKILKDIITASSVGALSGTAASGIIEFFKS